MKSYAEKSDIHNYAGLPEKDRFLFNYATRNCKYYALRALEEVGVDVSDFNLTLLKNPIYDVALMHELKRSDFAVNEYSGTLLGMIKSIDDMMSLSKVDAEKKIFLENLRKKVQKTIKDKKSASDPFPSISESREIWLSIENSKALSEFEKDTLLLKNQTYQKEWLFRWTHPPLSYSQLHKKQDIEKTDLHSKSDIVDAVVDLLADLELISSKMRRKDKHFKEEIDLIAKEISDCLIQIKPDGISLESARKTLSDTLSKIVESEYYKRFEKNQGNPLKRFIVYCLSYFFERFHLEIKSKSVLSRIKKLK